VSKPSFRRSIPTTMRDWQSFWNDLDVKYVDAESAQITYGDGTTGAKVLEGATGEVSVDTSGASVTVGLPNVIAGGTYSLLTVDSKGRATAGGTVTHNGTASLQGGTAGQYYHLTSAEVARLPYLLVGTGDPTGNLDAPQGAIFLRTDGGAVTTLYVKHGATVADWVAK